MRTEARLATAFLVLWGLISAPCRAIDLAEIEGLARRGETQQALDRLERELGKQPGEPGGQLLRGVLLVELNRTAEATRAFRLLKQQHPDRPEPINNLAVLQADSGSYETAIAALEGIIAHYPTYQTARINLEQVRLAKATGDVDPLSPDALRPEFLLTPRLGPYPRVDPPPPQPAAPTLTNVGGQTAEGPSYAAPRQPAELEPAAPVAMRPSAEPAADPQPAAIVDEVSPARAPEASTAEATRAASTKPSEASPRTELTRMVEAWTRAWSQQRVKEYLAFYAADFQPAGYPSRAAWESMRRQRVAAPAFIEVEVDLETMTVRETGPGEASVTFIQKYRSDRFGDTVEKTLDLVREDGVWRIRHETSG